MLYSFFPVSHDLFWMLVSVLLSFVLTFFAIKIGIARLPKDQGRKFAVNGEVAKGKPRGAGLIFSISSVPVLVPRARMQCTPGAIQRHFKAR